MNSHRTEWSCPKCKYRNGVSATAPVLSCAMCGRSRYAPIAPDTPGFTGNTSLTLDTSSFETSSYDPPSIPDSTPDSSSSDFGGGGGFDGGGGGSDF